MASVTGDLLRGDPQLPGQDLHHPGTAEAPLAAPRSGAGPDLHRRQGSGAPADGLQHLGLRDGLAPTDDLSVPGILTGQGDALLQHLHDARVGLRPALPPGATSDAEQAMLPFTEGTRSTLTGSVPALG